MTKRSGRCIQCNTDYTPSKPCACGARASLRDNWRSETRRSGRCLCGLLLAYHYAKDNRFLPCPEAQAAHPRAKVVKQSLRVLLCNAGASMAPSAMIFTGLHRGAVVGAILPRGK